MWRADRGLMLDVVQVVPALVQGRKLRRDTPHLPDAAGPTRGTAHPPRESAGTLRILVIGESTVAGVGAPTQELALAGGLARGLAQKTGRAVEWEAVGKDGARLDAIRRELLPRILERRPSVVFLVAGVNDVLHLTPPMVWGARLGALIDHFEAAGSKVVVAAVPPLEQFPVFGAPLRDFLVRRAEALDAMSARVCRERDVVFVPFGGFVLDARFFAEDRFHPSASGYAQVADLLAERAAGLV